MKRPRPFKLFRTKGPVSKLTRQPDAFGRQHRGSTLLFVILITAAISIVLGVLLKYGVSENRINYYHGLKMEARNAAEAVVESGFAQLVDRFNHNTSFPLNALSAEGSPLAIDESFMNFFGSEEGPETASNLIFGNQSSAWGSGDTELIGGVIPNGEWKYIDPRIPGNEQDKLKGRWVFIREVEVYGKATVEDPLSGRKTSAFCSQTLQVRDAPLFSHAIFYNMDLEIAPGPHMDITGAVHSNNNFYVQSNDGIDFYKAVTSAGDILHGRKPGSGQSTSNGNVTFTDGSGNQVSMNSGGWLDSNLDNWAESATDRWNGNVQSEDHNVPTHKLVEIDDYEADNPETAEMDDAVNAAYQLIMPVRSQGDSDYNEEIETQKYAYNAGITIYVDTDSLTYTLNSYQRDDEGNIVYDENTGEPEEYTLDDSLDPIARVEQAQQTWDSSAGAWRMTSGMGDPRRDEALNVVEIDIGKLKDLVEQNDADDWGGQSRQQPQAWWNGVAYVEIPEASSPVRSDGVRPSEDGWAVKLVNGDEIPNPAFAQARGTYGMTLATNNVLYVEGHYNADGDSTTGSATTPDNDSQPPAALVADAINFLSGAWQDERSFYNMYSSRGASSFTEVSAAIISGVVPTNKNGNGRYSGGVENFPRFLENWSGRTFRYRGSMVCLYESEVATEPWGSSNVYSPPRRDWGFNQLFADGYYPPGTPNTRTYRRTNFRDLQGDEYQNSIAQLTGSSND